MPSRQTTNRGYVESEGPDQGAVQEALSWILIQAGSAEAALFISVLNQLDSVEPHLGAGVIKGLRAHGKATVRGVPTRLFTERKLPPRFSGAVLALWPTADQLRKLEALQSSALCVVPWIASDLDVWKQTWQPLEIQTGNKAGASHGGSTGVLERAIGSLTNRVNVSTGLSHPSDKAAAVHLFRILRDGGEPFAAREVEVIASRAGWAPRHAHELAELAGKVAAGKRVQVRGSASGSWASDILEQWRRVDDHEP